MVILGMKIFSALRGSSRQFGLRVSEQGMKGKDHPPVQSCGC